MIERMISSPSPIWARPKEEATRLIASVAPRVKMISSRRLGVEEAAHGLARALIGVGRRIGEIMQAAMHIGVFVLVDMGDALDHLPRLLRRGGVVEIDEILAIGLFGEDRKVAADRLDIIGRGRFGQERLVHLPRLPSAEPGADARRDKRRASLPRRDRLDDLAGEAFDQQRLGLMLGQAARHEIEQLVVVEPAASGAMAADARRRRRFRAPACCSSWRFR